MWTVRSEPIDSPEASALLRAFFRELVDRYWGKPMPGSQVDFAMHESPSIGFAAFLVARYDGRPAGCAGLRVSGALTRMFVAPEFRRMGGGRVLLAAIEETAREL